MSKTKKAVASKPKPKIITIEERPRLVLGKDLMNLFNFFHNQVGKDEWSGILFYTVKGSIKDISKMEFKANNMMLKDIGTAAYTSYEFDESVLDFYDTVPETEDMKLGMVHTHHDMNNYFSPTDMDELKDNAQNHNYYLSLIASFDCNYTAKLAIHARVKDSTVIIKGDNGEDIEQVIASEDIVYVANCDIIFELDSFNIDAVSKLEKRAKERLRNKNKKTTSKQGQLYPVKPSKEGVKNKTNPLADPKEVSDAIVAVLYCNMYDTEETSITPWLAFKRMNEVLLKEEVEEYIDTVEIHMQDVVSYRFGGSELDLEEFVDTAIKHLEKLDLEENEVLDEFMDMLKFYSSEHDDVFDEEEIIAI